LEYSAFPDRYIEGLELQIEKSIIENIEKWREGKITRWNKLCSRTFKTLLPTLDADKVSGLPLSSRLTESQELNSLKNVYSMVGFPLNMPYTDIHAILNTVRNTDVHSNSEKGLEFAVAVHCIGLPGRLVSVWIYLASLKKTF
jgi:hypothetical protein